MLLGQLDGSYALVATSSLGIESGAATFLALTDTPNSLSTGSLVYANAPDSLAELPISSNGLVLKLQGGLPVWAFDLRAHRADGSGQRRMEHLRRALQGKHLHDYFRA